MKSEWFEFQQNLDLQKVYFSLLVLNALYLLKNLLKDISHFIEHTLNKLKGKMLPQYVVLYKIFPQALKLEKSGSITYMILKNRVKIIPNEPKENIFCVYSKPCHLDIFSVFSINFENKP